VLINESGRVDAVHIVASEPMRAFDEAVKTAFGSARYRPGMKAGRSVKSQMLVEVTFHGGASAGPVSARPN
jgi:TonB family protein